MSSTCDFIEKDINLKPLSSEFIRIWLSDLRQLYLGSKIEIRLNI